MSVIGGLLFIVVVWRAARDGATRVTAREARSMSCAANMAVRAVWAASDLAATMTPDVSLSRRWTMPGRKGSSVFASDWQ